LFFLELIFTEHPHIYSFYVFYEEKRIQMTSHAILGRIGFSASLVLLCILLSVQDVKGFRAYNSFYASNSSVFKGEPGLLFTECIYFLVWSLPPERWVWNISGSIERA
jgi:hypothetical protein